MANPPQNRQPIKRFRIPQRWVIACLGFLGIFSAFTMRNCLSIAITEMTSSHNSTGMHKSNNSYIGNGNLNSTLELAKHSNIVKYNWSEKTQGLILSSFYWGYVFTSIQGGLICRKLGGKLTLGLSILSISLFTIVTPYCIYWGGATGLIILRIAMGFGEGTTYPAIVDLMAHWIPKDERSIAGAVVFSGASLGATFGIFTSGVILEHSESGWPMVFYFQGTVGIIFFLLNAAFCYNRPSESPYTSDEELKYLKNKLDNTETAIPPTPWRHILTSPAVLSSIIAKFGLSWGYITIASDLPKYMSKVFKLSAQDNGYLSAFPYLAKLIFSLAASWCADKVIAENRLSITIVRKIGTTLALTGSAIFLVASFYAGHNRLLAVTLQSIGIALMGCAYFSVTINALDLSPNYASSIVGLGNGIAVTSGALSPYIVGVMTPNQTIGEWQSVFWIVFAIFVSSNLVYLVYGSGEVQGWNDTECCDKERTDGVCDVEKVAELSPLNKS